MLPPKYSYIIIILVITLFVLPSATLSAAIYDDTELQQIFGSEPYTIFYNILYNCRPVEELETSYLQLALWIDNLPFGSEAKAVAKARAAMVLGRNYVQEEYCRNYDRAKELLEESLALLNTAAVSAYSVESLLIEGEVYGAYFLTDQVKYLFSYGRKSNDIVQKVWKADQHNPRSILLKSNQLIYTPKLFGGDLKKARDLLLKIADLHLLPVEKFTAYSSLGLVEQNSRKEELARKYYQKAAEIYPFNNYIQELLLSLD